MTTRELLFEIGTEEIPAAALSNAVRDLKRLAEESFKNNKIECEGVEAYGTPRRLVLYVNKMAEKQADSLVEKRGPATRVAYDADGNPTKALIGFAKGLGVDVADVEILKSDKGEYVNVSKTIKGEETSEVLGALLSQLIFDIPFKKSMRWSDGSIRFSRPIHWILSLFGSDVVSFSIGDFSKGAIKSGNVSCGHRFLSPSKFQVKDFKHYKTELKKRFVVVDAAVRKSMITDRIDEIKKENGLDIIKDHDLLEHVANLVEYPVTVSGSFDEKFLALPKEVLVNSMKVHQKYFATTKRGDDDLTNSFINVLNTRPKDQNVVIKGNERVLRARLSDAEFFYNEDKKKALDSFNERLSGVIFHKKLGTMHEKVERIKELSKFIAGYVSEGLDAAAARAAELCKADLVTEMVGEFPKLQGVMGREYALLAGEEKDVAAAIYEHYLPISADGALPETVLGMIISIADKIDTIVSCFSVGLMPTGSADPFALRRQTLGIINMLNELASLFKRVLPVDALVKKAFDAIRDKAKRDEAETISDVLQFFSVRMKNMITQDGFKFDVVDAVLALGLNNINESFLKITALSEFKNRPDFEALSVSFKRVANIVKGVSGDVQVDAALFSDDSESELYKKYDRVKSSVDELCKKHDYLEALEVTTKLKELIDNFFDTVLVMDKDEKVKNNRLALLQNIQNLFLNIADFSKIN
ncbi:glycine--tRNA ligase subunit beta [Thermodesulfobacteriota bacterium]